MSENDYLLLSDAEKSRLQLQAQVWEPEAGRLFDQIGVQAGWHCLDVGCGLGTKTKPVHIKIIVLNWIKRQKLGKTDDGCHHKNSGGVG